MDRKSTRLLIAGMMLLMNAVAFSQQLKLGKNPYVIEKSAVLELQSDNQGLLFSRVVDTVRINSMNPPDGMVIFHIPSLQLLLRTGGYWKPLTVTSALTNFWSTTGNTATTNPSRFLGTTNLQSLYFRTNNTQSLLIDSLGNVGIGTAPVFSAAPFREKFLVDAGNTGSINAIVARGTIDNYLQLNIQNLSTGTFSSSDLVATANNGSETTNYVDLGINGQNYSNGIMGSANDAYLYNVGQNFLIANGSASKSLIFMTGGTSQASNERMRIDGTGRVGLGVTSPTAFLHLKAGTTTASTAPLKFTSGALLATPEAGAFEYLTDKFYGTITSSSARKEFTLNDIGLTAGRVPFATSNGRLTDLPTLTYTSNRLFPQYLTLGAGTAAAGTAPLIITAGVNLTVPVSGAIEFDGTHFYGTVGSTRYALDQQAGTTYTASNGIALIDNDLRNTLFTGISGDQTITGGTAAGNSLILSSTSNAAKGKIVFGSSAYNEANNRLGIGNTNPGEALDVTGSLQFSGALMPNGNAGSPGYFFISAGAGNAPTWNALDTNNINNFYQKSRSLLSAGAGINYNAATGVISSSINTGNFWSLGGNSVGILKTLGTIDNNDLPFVTNNTENMRLTSSGFLGIGTSSPSNKLSVLGTNPLFLSGVQTGSVGDSLLTISAGVVKKLNITALSSLAVTSVGLSLPSIFSVSGSPVTTSGVLTGTLVAQPPNRFFAGPAAGANAAPAFRALAPADLPIATATLVGGVSIGAGLSVTADGILSATNTNSGTVTTITASGTQGVTTSILNASTTPSLSIGLGAITPASVSSTGTISGSNLSGTNTGDQTITLTSDVTGSGKGSFATTISPNAVSFSKMQQVSANKLLGNPGATTANVSEISLGTGFSFSGSTLNYTPVISGTVTSVGLSLPDIFSVTVSPVTTSGSLTAVLTAQAANKIFAGPATGANAAPGFRSLVSADLPVATTSTLGGISVGSGLSVTAAGVLSAVAATNVWNQGGNTVSSIKKLGTIDNIDLPFITNNTEKMRLTSAGYLGIGTSTPSTLLHITGNNPLTLIGVQVGAVSDSLLTITSGTVKKLPFSAVTGSSWSLLGNSGSNSGSNFLGTSDNSSLSFRTNNIPRMYIDSASGNIGVGTASPASDLTIFQKTGAMSSRGIRFAGTPISGANTGSGFAMTLGYNVQNNKQLWLGDADYLGNSAGTFFRFSSTGGFTIIDAINGDNTLRRAISLGVAGDANSGVVLGSDNNAVSPTSFVWANGNMAIGNGYRATSAPANGLLVQGNVGIGTSSPASVLDVAGAIGFSGALKPGNAPGASGEFLMSTGSATPPVWFNADNLITTQAWGLNGNGNTISSNFLGTTNTMPLSFRTSNAERLRIDATGKVGIGTTIPSQKLDVDGNVNVQGSVYVDGDATNTGSVSPGIVLGGASSGETISSKRTIGTNQYGIDFYTASTLRMTIFNNGDVGIGTGTSTPVASDKLTVAGTVSPSANGVYNLGNTTNRWLRVYAINGTISTSDRRAKTNIAELRYGLKEVLALKPVSYNWKKTPEDDKMLGLVAQEVKEIIPEVVVGDESKEMLGMKYAELIPVLINAIKEQQKQIDELKQEIKKLQK